MRGYYFDSGALARCLWEVALSLAAAERGVIGVDAVFFGGGGAPDKEPTMREFQARSIRIDRQIQKAMLWGNAALSVEVRAAIETFVALANLATHKSKLQLATTLMAAKDGREAPVFPHFDRRAIEWTTNMLYMATWSILATLPYLGPLIPSASTPWHARYDKLMSALTIYFEQSPKPTVKAFGKAVAALFLDRSPLPQTPTTK